LGVVGDDLAGGDYCCVALFGGGEVVDVHFV
jgi:hypothetical protein